MARPERNEPDFVDRIAPERRVGNPPVLELIAVDHSHGPGPVRVIPIRIPVVESPAEEDAWIIVVAQRGPADIRSVPIPMDPGRPPAPGRVRDPIPAEMGSPTPPAEMHRAPAPGLVRYPCPADDRIPLPPAVVIRAPIVVVDRRDPDMAIG